MDPTRWKKIEALYEAAEGLPPEARVLLLERECAGDDGLRREVEALLATDDRAESFLENPAFVIPTPPPLRSLHDSAPDTMVGRRIGAYRISSVIGAGGMGVVYLAEQDFPRRTVALKVLRPSLATPSMQRRFEHEAQILGRLHHPGIAQIFEAGLAPDHENPLGMGVRAFIAMERVNGSSIKEFANTRRLSVDQRLELFAKVCDAVQHAHQKGVIHRDLKPGNILVDESPIVSARGAPAGSAGRDSSITAAQPKVLDFGVARATDSDRRATTMGTGIGQLIGTLPYMSPEQVKGNPDDLDTRADVYALGVVLYELLSGTLPHELAGCSLPEAARIIREEAPGRLSAVSRVFRGEIETIVAKALEKDRARRYQSAAALADDVRRYLAGEPISAKRDSALYVLRKQINRYKSVSAAAAVCLILLGVFTVSTWVQSQRNARLAAERLQAQQEALAALSEARDQRARATQNALALDLELTRSTIEQGRLAGIVGHSALAEDLLWTSFMRNPSSPHAYWALWEYFSRQPREWTAKVHQDIGTRAVLSPDGGALYTSSLDGSVAALNPDGPGVRARARLGAGGVVDLALHPEGEVLAAAPEDGLLHLLSARTLEPLACLHPGAGAGRVYSAVWNADGSRLAVGCEDGLTRVWTLQTGHAWPEPGADPQVLFGHRRYVKALTFARRADGRDILATMSQDSTIRVWDLGTGETTMIIPLNSPFSSNLIFTRDGESLFVGSADRTVRRIHVDTGIIEWATSRLNGTIRSLALSPDGLSLYAGGWYFAERLDAVTGTPDERPFVRANRVNALALTPEGERVHVITDGGEVSRWDTRAHPAMVRRMYGATGFPGALMDPESRTIVTTTRAPELRMWDADTGEQQHTIRSLPGQPRTLCRSPDGSTLAVAVGSGRVLMYDTACWAPRPGQVPHRAPVADLEFSADGARLYSISADGSIAATDTATGACLWYDHSIRAEGLRMALHPSGKQLAVTHRLNSVQVYDAEAGQLLAQLPLNATAWSVAYGHEGDVLYCGNWASEIARWDARTWEELPALRGHTQTVYALGIGPQGRLIASGSQDTTVKLWDVWSGQCVATLEGGPGEIASVSFDPSGTHLLVVRNNNSVDDWDLTFFRRHIAGNLPHQLSLRRTRPDSRIDLRLLQAWINITRDGPVNDEPLRDR